MNRSTALKAKLIGSPIEPIAKALRNISCLPKRLRYPELWEIYLEDERFSKVVRKLITPNATVLDVGCHLGSFLSFILSLKQDCSLIAIEASSDKCGLLKKGFPQVELHNCAAGSENKVAVFEENEHSSGYSKLLGSSEKVEGNRYSEVQVQTIDAIVGSRQIDFIKLDIEGAELDALRGAANTLARCAPPIVFECGSEYNNPPPPKREIFDFLTSRGYAVHTLGDYLFEKGPLQFDEFRRRGIYPFRAFNFVAVRTQ